MRETLAKLKLFRDAQTDLDTIINADYLARNHDTISILRRYANTYQFGIVEPFPVFCEMGTCAYSVQEGLALYEDDNHLNNNGAQRLIGPILEKIVRHR